MQTTQNTVTQAQALQHCAQQLQYVTDAANKHTYCLNTAQEIVHVLQQLLSANANYAAIVAATRYSSDCVDEEKYL
jgi:alkylhydroperoxidase/carboxymuconolactone decarboxylase family protein YurZ